MSEYKSAKVGEPPVEMFWTCIAADTDGVVDTEKIGQRTRELRAAFAFKVEAQAWLSEQRGKGLEVEGPTPLATPYFGPTDSPSNCWSAKAEEVVAA